MSKIVNIEASVSAIKGECSCPIEWFEELFDNDFIVVLKIKSDNCVVKEITNMQDLREYVESTTTY